MLNEYIVEYLHNGAWTAVTPGNDRESRTHITRFDPVYADAVRVRFTRYDGLLAIAEVGVYTPYRK